MNFFYKPAAKFRSNIYFPKNDWKTAEFYEVINVLLRVVSATVIFFLLISFLISLLRRKNRKLMYLHSFYLSFQSYFHHHLPWTFSYDWPKNLGKSWQQCILLLSFQGNQDIAGRVRCPVLLIKQKKPMSATVRTLSKITLHSLSTTSIFYMFISLHLSNSASRLNDAQTNNIEHLLQNLWWSHARYIALKNMHTHQLVCST